MLGGMLMSLHQRILILKESIELSARCGQLETVKLLREQLKLVALEAGDKELFNKLNACE